jgi:hypothetical protein
MKQVHCPQCGSGRVHRSRRRSPLEQLAGIAGSLTRCHECGVRTLQMAGCVVRVEALERGSRWLAAAVVAAAVAIAILFAIVLFGRMAAGGGALLLTCLP